MSAQPSITEFIEARLREREAMARLASPGPWHLNDEGDGVLAVDDIEVVDAFALSSNQQRNTAAHIAANDPAYVLADIAAKRRILAACREANSLRNAYGLADDTGDDVAWIYDNGALADQVVRLLAAPFAAHEQFDPNWAVAEHPEDA